MCAQKALWSLTRASEMQSWVETGPSVKLHRGNVRLPFPDKPPARCSETPACPLQLAISTQELVKQTQRFYFFFPSWPWEVFTESTPFLELEISSILWVPVFIFHDNWSECLDAMCVSLPIDHKGLQLSSCLGHHDPRSTSFHPFIIFRTNMSSSSISPCDLHFICSISASN